MGSDFCLEYFSITENEEPKWSTAREVIEKMSKIHISKWSRVFGEGDNVDIGYFFERFESAGIEYEDEVQPDMNDRIRICESLIEELRKVREAWENGTRDSVTITLRGRDYLFTGGMSWGDPPTELYESIGKLLCTGILKAAGFEDH